MVCLQTSCVILGTRKAKRRKYSRTLYDCLFSVDHMHVHRNDNEAGEARVTRSLFAREADVVEDAKDLVMNQCLSDIPSTPRVEAVEDRGRI